MQDYQLFVRTIWGGATQYQNQGKDLYVQNSQETLDYLREFYLSNGYEIKEVHFLGDFNIDESQGANSPKALRFAWHLVKNVSEAKENKAPKA